MAVRVRKRAARCSSPVRVNRRPARRQRATFARMLPRRVLSRGRAIARVAADFADSVDGGTAAAVALDVGGAERMAQRGARARIFDARRVRTAGRRCAARLTCREADGFAIDRRRTDLGYSVVERRAAATRAFGVAPAVRGADAGTRIRRVVDASGASAAR